jgi:tol-pal system protein YbgF
VNRLRNHFDDLRSAVLLWYAVSEASHIFGVVAVSKSRAFCHADQVVQGKMSFRFMHTTGAAAFAVLLALGSPGLAQSDDADPEIRIQRLENQLRQLTGQNEELQYRNRQLEERLRQLQGGVQPAPGGPAAASNTAPVPGSPAYRPSQQVQPAQAQPAYGQPQPGYEQPQIAAPAPIIQEQAEAPAAVQPGRRRGDAFDPSQNPNAPGAPQALGRGQLTIPADSSVGAPGGRGAGEPLDLANTAGARYPQGNPPANLPPPPPRNPVANAAGGLATARPKDEFDLGIGYMQRKDYALAEETMRNFSEKYPNDPLLGDSQYWLGESYYKRQQYREAAEVFLGVTTKYAKSAKAPDALLRLGQSLAALKEKEAACAALGEVMRKYPRASAGVTAEVNRELKGLKC